MAAVNVCAVRSPEDGFGMLTDKGMHLNSLASSELFLQSFFGGCYIGFGTLVAGIISSSMPGLTEDNPGLQDFVFAALFPVNLLFVLLTGGVLFTGAAAVCPAAVIEGKSTIFRAVKGMFVVLIGNAAGGLVFAYFTKRCDLLEGSTAVWAIAATKKKIKKGFFTMFLKGIGSNWMVNMAVFMCGQAQDMTGKYVAIWFPISAFVMIGFEHIPANFYLCDLGYLAENSELTFSDIVIKNWLPVLCGNFVAGALIVAAGYSYAYGRIGSYVSDLGGKATTAGHSGCTRGVHAGVIAEERNEERQKGFARQGNATLLNPSEELSRIPSKKSLIEVAKYFGEEAGDVDCDCRGLDTAPEGLKIAAPASGIVLVEV
eukprot:TRINITY_DN90873_c0_g1_i1.p1 TRINITY_DN90873_c0_g1~~TRINITY_DN90873_c0_g1_i1.p1  ORF type:complete len:372 (+),score=57.01 TRINITY_DN90873_c0_g1_i1:120-1235(+)